MTKAELEAKVVELTALLAALTAQLAETPAVVEVVPDPVVAPPVVAEEYDEDGYGPYNEHWCRKYKPLVDLLDEYENDGNRYHELMVKKFDYEESTQHGYAARDAVYLIKPKTGFVSKEHETFFLRAYNGNRNRSHYLPKSSKFYKGRVFTSFRKQLWQLPFPWVVGLGVDFVYGEECPFSGTGTQDAAEKSRELFETWWTRDKVLKYNWKFVLQLIKALDQRHADGASEISLQKLYPWWRKDDGSPAVL